MSPAWEGSVGLRDEEERGGTRILRDTPQGRGYNPVRAVSSNGESERLQQRTLPLAGRLRGDPTTAGKGSNDKGFLLNGCHGFVAQ